MRAGSGAAGGGGEGSLHKTMHQSLEPQTRSLETGRPHPGLGWLSSGPQGDVRWEGQARAKGREKVGARPGQSLPYIPEEARVKTPLWYRITWILRNEGKEELGTRKWRFG